MQQRVPITREGFERLRSELERLQREERPAVLRAIEEARGHGDISENAEFEAAKEKQALIEGRINELYQKIGHSEIIACAADHPEKAVFGVVVVLADLETGQETSYRLVGPYEADIQAGTLSVASPLGQALIGKQEGDEIRVQTPKGVRQFEVVELRC
jgi:transcription elongation factor GreA